MRNKCKNSDCYAHVNDDKPYRNHCCILTETYKDDVCPFYKSKSEVSWEDIKKAQQAYAGRK